MQTTNHQHAQPEQFIDITNLLDVQQCSCMNEQISGSFKNMLQSNTNTYGNTYTKSLVDPQLLIQLFFRQCVTISHIEFEVSTNDTCPKLIKLFSNKLNMGFDDASTLTPIETIRLIKNIPIQKYKLQKPSFWSRSDIVHIFVENNYGGEFTEIKNIKIYGFPIDNTDVSKIRGCCC